MSPGWSTWRSSDSQMTCCGCSVRSCRRSTRTWGRLAERPPRSRRRLVRAELEPSRSCVSRRVSFRRRHRRLSPEPRRLVPLVLPGRPLLMYRKCASRCSRSILRHQGQRKSSVFWNFEKSPVSRTCIPFQAENRWLTFPAYGLNRSEIRLISFAVRSLTPVAGVWR
jgi:hypothetical protein